MADKIKKSQKGGLTLCDFLFLSISMPEGHPDY